MDIVGHIKSYETEDTVDTTRAVLEFIKDSSDPFSKDNIRGHITGSAWIIDREFKHALLTHHKKLNIWIQTGGHSENEIDPLLVAWREGEEESGLKIYPLFKDLFQLDIHHIPKYKGTEEHLHYDFTYIFTADSSEKLIRSSESKGIKWVKIDELERYSEELNILNLRKRTINLIKSMDRSILEH